MSILNIISDSWGWTGIKPDKIIGENHFGNLMIKDVEGKFWRICPEDLYCEVIAQSKDELDIISKDPEFLEDWYMKNLVYQAEEKFGELEEGKKFCFAIPGSLGGEYGITNIKTAPLTEIIGFSGDVANQIKDLPDGSQVNFEFID